MCQKHLKKNLQCQNAVDWQDNYLILAPEFNIIENNHIRLGNIFIHICVSTDSHADNGQLSYINKAHKLKWLPIFLWLFCDQNTHPRCN